MKKFLLSIIILIIGLSNSFATHNRAGEITYKWLSGYTYEITVTTYTNTYNTTADRCEVTVYFGDGDSAVAPRINGPSSLCPSTADGVMLSSPANTKWNIYKTSHTYHGPNTYVITMEDPNRNEGVANIPSSVNVSFFLRTELVINPFLGSNSSCVLLNPPLDQACVGVCFEHNPGAYDADGDSLYYRMSTCYANGVPIPGWSFPANMSDNSIDHHTGDLVWCSPNTIATYNVAIVIEEWKLLLTTHKRYFAGSILRDMQIDVTACNNTPPTITSLPDTCIVAGANLHFTVSASDPEGEMVTLSAAGGPFLLSPAASFPTVSNNGSVTGTFDWTPDCSEVKLLPYEVTFKAEDGNQINPLVNFESMFITVVAPAPTGLTATPSGSSIILNWSPPACNNIGGANPLKGYSIYRKEACDPWVHGVCETGVPTYSGYTLIGTVNTPVPPATTFTDNNNGAGLLHGIDYSYIVVAFYSDGSQSYASGNICAQLVRDVPIITNVSVLTTGASGNGSIWTHWVRPLGTSQNLDTLADPGPYQYRLMKASGTTGTLVYNQVASYSYPAYWQLTDTGAIVTGLNTQDSAYTFRVDFYSNGNLKGSTHTASSVYLSSSPSDNTVTLNWQQTVPWVNYKFYIWKEIPTGSSTFILIDSTTAQTYADTGLPNGRSFCYKVESVGEYSDNDLPKPLFNMSQIKCETPVDLIPPCQPEFYVASDCETTQNSITWVNPNTYCSNDAVKYNIYFARTLDDPLQLVQTINDINTTTFGYIDNYEGVPSVAGCYAVTAIDSFGNESPVIKKTCIDNCPLYQLPNVFTPNGDNINDLFMPLLPYRYIKDIDIKIYDRWGLLMFESKDLDIKWDGKNKDTKKQCVDGTYFYVCYINEIHVEGIRQRVLKGFIQLINTKTGPNN
jgi:gliding motility-associated-like protein